MKNLICTLLLISLASGMGLAQEIEIEKVKRKYHYSLNDTSIDRKDMVQIMQDQPEALKMIKQARVTKTLSALPIMAGCFVIGYKAGEIISDNWHDALIDDVGIAAGLIGLGLLINGSAQKATHRAVILYNQSQTPNLPQQELITLQLKTTRNGVGFVVRF